MNETRGLASKKILIIVYSRDLRKEGQEKKRADGARQLEASNRDEEEDETEAG